MSLKVTLLPWQTQVQKDKHRFRIICAGRRAGKSVLSRMIVLDWATKKQGLYWIVSPTYKQSKQIHWRDYQNEIPQAWIQKKNEVDLSITLKNGSIIELKGAENPDALRGVKLRGLVIDEIASIRNWDWLWSEVLRPTLTDYEAPTIFISTPKGYNHFYDLYQIGRGENEDYRSWKFTSYDNPTISKGEIDNAKEELTEDTFAQEYLADFRKFTGLVYKDFDRSVHLVKPFPIPDSWVWYGGIDFGSTNPTAALWIAVDNDSNWFIVAEYYQTQKTIDHHAGVIRTLDQTHHQPRARYGDPSGAQWISEFNQRSIYVTPANKETGTNYNSWVRYGIAKVEEKLKPIPGHSVSVPEVQDGIGLGGRKSLPSLFIFDTCENLIREFETYRWKEKSVAQAQDLNEPDVPEKANDHAMDALRYFAVSYRKHIEAPIRPTKNWRIA